MPKLRYALNSADAATLRSLAAWFRKQAQTAETLATAADDDARQQAHAAALVALCRAGRFDQAEQAGAPADMLAAWRQQHRRQSRRQQLEQRRERVRALLDAGLSQRRIARAVGISLGRVNQLAAQLRANDPRERMLPGQDHQRDPGSRHRRRDARICDAQRDQHSPA